MRKSVWIARDKKGEFKQNGMSTGRCKCIICRGVITNQYGRLASARTAQSADDQLEEHDGIRRNGKVIHNGYCDRN